MLPENSSEKKAPNKTEPFPWRCRHCGRPEVAPATVDYPLEISYDGRSVHFVARGISIPTCAICGEKLVTGEVDRQINRAFHEHMHLLTPDQIRDGIAKLGLSQKEVAEQLGIAEATLSRWLTETVIQSRAMDNYLRVFFQFPEVRRALAVVPMPIVPTNVALPDTT
jgi:putative zinc finger/helix-turn-helix YgiT family protein